MRPSRLLNINKKLMSLRGRSNTMIRVNISECVTKIRIEKKTEKTNTVSFSKIMIMTCKEE